MNQTIIIDIGPNLQAIFTGAAVIALFGLWIWWGHKE